MYYNDSVCLQLNYELSPDRSLLANIIFHLCRERTLLCGALPDEVDCDTDRSPIRGLRTATGCQNSCQPDICTGDCNCVLTYIPAEEHHQCRTALESVENSGWSGLGRASKGETGINISIIISALL